MGHNGFSPLQDEAFFSDDHTQGFARFLVPGQATGPVVYSDIPLSFMLGVDIKTGEVADTHHPLCGTSLAGCVVAIPCGRGSCSASGVILELLLSGLAPAALVFNKTEDILALGVLVAKAMFDRSIPVLVVEDARAFSLFKTANIATLGNDEVVFGRNGEHRLSVLPPRIDCVELTPYETSMLNGEHGHAARIAMETIVTYAAMQATTSLIEVSQAHIDACIYVGKSSLLIPERLLSMGARFAIPATCNSLSVDRLRWRDLGSEPEISTTASKIGDAYLAMGAKMSFTCAPYLLETKPGAGEQIGWAESNAVVFANSVLGARTQKYPDYLDVFIALTGRAPYAGCHTDSGRYPKIRIDVPTLNETDDSLFPLLGYHIGEITGSNIPLILGLERSDPTTSDLKAFGAGFATTSSAPMFHIMGVTPEAQEFGELELSYVTIKLKDLMNTWRGLNSASESSVDVVSLGNPHFALEEFSLLATLCHGRQKHGGVEMIITTSRDTYQKALKDGCLDTLESFGARVITDTCWCMIEEPIIPPYARNIMTNSAKYAHYGPGAVKKGFHFGSLKACVDSACTGQFLSEVSGPSWLGAIQG